jgi:hypothetical protein
VASEGLDAVSTISPSSHEGYEPKEGRRAGGKQAKRGGEKEGSRKATYPEDTSQTLIVLSLLAETNRSPSCVNRTVEIL